MDAAVADWMNRVSIPVDRIEDHATLLSEGVDLMRAEPALPRVLAADIHCRLAALAFIIGDKPMAVRHAKHAGDMARDMTIEGQLHVLARVIPLLVHSLPPDDVASDPALETASTVFGVALETSVSATDEQLTRLATLEAVSVRLGQLEPDDADAVRAVVAAEATRLRGVFERVGELGLASSATVLETV